jgi:hypothetical protein
LSVTELDVDAFLRDAQFANWTHSMYYRLKKKKLIGMYMYMYI